MEGLDETYRLFYTQWKEACMVVEKKKKPISDLFLEKQKLGSSIVGMEEEVTLLKSKLDNMTKFVRMFNNGSKALDEILEVGNMANNVKGIGFYYNSMIKETKFPTKKFIPLRRKLIL